MSHFVRVFIGFVLIAVAGAAMTMIRQAHPELTETEVALTYWPKYVLPAILVIVGGYLAIR